MDYVALGRQVNPEQSRIDEGLNKWMLRYAHRHYWRVASWYELDDLIMDGYFILAKCEEKYAEVSQRDFMNLFKVCYANHITDLANKRTKSISDIPMSQFGDDFNLEALIGGEADDTAEILDLIRRAPWEVRQVLELLLSEDGLKKVLGAQWEMGGLRGDHNTRLCRLVGLDPKETDLVNEIRLYLGAAA